MSKALKGVDIDDDAFVQIEAIIRSMTPGERRTQSFWTQAERKELQEDQAHQDRRH